MSNAMDDYRYLVYTDKPNQIYNESGEGGSVEPATSAPAMDGTAAVGSSDKYAREDHIHPTDTSRASSTHSHGNITNAGAMTTGAVIASGDKLIIADSSDQSKIKGASTAFGSSTTTFLANNGTWQTPSGAITGVKGDDEETYRTGNINMTCEDIGAADATHVHSTDDITSGILPVSHGGTGTTGYLENGVIEKINSSSVISTANGHWKNGGSFTLAPGTYLAIIHTEWATNTTGIRSHTLSTDDPDSADFAIPPNSTSSGTFAANGTARMTTAAFLSPASSTTYYLGLYQTSGGALNCSTRRVRVIRLA